MGRNFHREPARRNSGNAWGARTRGDDLAGDESISALNKERSANLLKITLALRIAERWLSCPFALERNAGHNALS